MSRGGFRGGRGGGGRGGSKIGGMDLPFEVDPELKIDYTPRELFPKFPIPVPPPPTVAEKLQISRLRSIRDRIHEGPFYTVFDKDPTASRIDKAARYAPAHLQLDAFNNMPTYSRKYMRRRRRMPRLDTRPYELRFFPDELYETLEPKTGAAERSKKRRKVLQIMKSNRLSRLERLEEDNEDLLSEDEDEEMEKGSDVEGEDGVEEQKDTDFEEDEDEDDDYNAERYFDNGEDDDFGADNFGDDGGAGYDWEEV